MATQAEKIETNELFIGGERVALQGSARIDVVSPSTEEPIGSVPEGSEGDIDAAVRAARAALPEWSGRPVEERVDTLMRLAQALEARGEDTAQRVCRSRCLASSRLSSRPSLPATTPA
jgi:aldehyde dehydrogenase (NAD+)